MIENLKKELNYYEKNDEKDFDFKVSLIRKEILGSVNIFKGNNKVIYDLEEYKQFESITSNDLKRKDKQLKHVVIDLNIFKSWFDEFKRVFEETMTMPMPILKVICKF